MHNFSKMQLLLFEMPKPSIRDDFEENYFDWENIAPEKATKDDLKC